MRTAILYLAIMWGLELADYTLFARRLANLGLHPQQTDFVGFVGIFTCAFLHGNWGHLLSNTIGYIPLSTLVLLKNRGQFIGLFWFIAIFDGIGVWLIGQPGTIHIGASGILFGFYGFLMLSSLFQVDIISLIACTLVMILLDQIIGGMNPNLSGFRISWEGHLMGFIAGSLVGCVRNFNSWFE